MYIYIYILYMYMYIYLCIYGWQTSAIPCHYVLAGGEGNDPHGEFCPGRAERQGDRPMVCLNGGG